MHLKKCAGCARAIVESAAVCQYCGHGTTAPVSQAPATRPDAVEEDPFAFLHDQIRQDVLPIDEQTIPADAAPADDELPVHATAMGGGDHAPLFESAAVHDQPLAHDHAPVQAPRPAEKISLTPPRAAAAAKAPAPLEDSAARVQIVPVDEDLPSLDELWKDSAPSAPVADEHLEAPASVAAAPSPSAATPPKSRRATTVAIGLVAGIVLIVAALGVRGTASPTPADAPAAAARKTPAAATAAKPAAKPATKAASVVGPVQTWNRVTDGRWVGRDRKSVALELNANAKVAIWMRQVRPVLVVRCMGKSTDVFVFTQTAAKMEPQDENHTVNVGLDDGQPSTERWADSEEHDALFAPDGVALVRQLMQSRTLRFGFTPHNAAPVVAEFNVEGLSELLAPSARQCGWKQ